MAETSPNDDRERWNKRFLANQHTETTPSPTIASLQHWLPPGGDALDLAGGAGRHAIWLAAQGFRTSLIDVSDVALRLAQERARQVGIPLTTIEHDLLVNGMPRGEYHVILSVLFLHRPLLPAVANSLRDGGRLLMLQPTKTNLQRRSKPPERFLLEDGELPQLLEDAGLKVLHYQEGWLAEGRHDAVAVAEKS